MNEEIRTDKFWEYVPNFIKKDIRLEALDIEIIGYFPYHTARLRPAGIGQAYPPRTLFECLEIELIKHHIYDNKAVYICKPIKAYTGVTHFAIMLKDDYVMIGTWESVVSYDNKALKLMK